MGEIIKKVATVKDDLSTLKMSGLLIVLGFSNKEIDYNSNFPKGSFWEKAEKVGFDVLVWEIKRTYRQRLKALGDLDLNKEEFLQVITAWRRIRKILKEKGIDT